MLAEQPPISTRKKIPRCLGMNSYMEFASKEPPFLLSSDKDRTFPVWLNLSVAAMSSFHGSLPLFRLSIICISHPVCLFRLIGIALYFVIPARFSRVLFSSEPKLSEGENVVVPLITDSLEWTLSSPPPLHQFEEPPLIVEIEHLNLRPGAEVEDVLAEQGEKVTDIIGKEAWVDNDPALYDGLIPQNEDWTEFVDEKTGEWVYMDEYGQRISKP
eukprot:scaffold36096_cov59-Attheya_sp.AAC.1